MYELKTKGGALKATERPVDTGTTAGRVFLDMLGVFGEFETNLQRERQLEGISAAKVHGVYKGRKSSVHRPAAIACRLGIGRTSVYRLPDEQTGRTIETTDADQA